ncbi:MAG: Na/Pi symporter [Halanaerobiales bacterium]|nr:Na/Pi symporter [Halanaerobiales bacterium]
MHIFLIGLFLFLLGLEGTKRSIKIIATAKIKAILQGLSENIFLAVLIGTIITAVLQSSSAVTIILIALLEAGLLNIRSAMGIVLGANIGTTVTVQIISLPILSFFPLIIISGVVLILIGIIFRSKIFFGGLAIFSFGIVLAGLELMTGYFQNPGTHRLIEHCLAYSGTNPYKGILVGILITGVIQSSSLVTGITVVLANNNLITLASAVAITLGSNIGTCVTAFIASINSGQVARSMVWGHFFFNLIGVLVILPCLGWLIALVRMSSPNLVRQIANAHTLFNLFNLLLFLPFLNPFISFLGGNKDGDN